MIIREIINDLKRYDLSKIVENEVDFIVGMVVNKMLNKYSAYLTKDSKELTYEEKEVFYRNVGMLNLRYSVRRLTEV
ncbi:MAG: hypothetical protein ACJ73C_14280 [Nitrososphaeraceae archaeon]